MHRQLPFATLIQVTHAFSTARFASPLAATLEPAFIRVGGCSRRLPHGADNETIDRKNELSWSMVMKMPPLVNIKGSDLLRDSTLCVAHHMLPHTASVPGVTKVNRRYVSHPPKKSRGRRSTSACTSPTATRHKTRTPYLTNIIRFVSATPALSSL